MDIGLLVVASMVDPCLCGLPEIKAVAHRSLDLENGNCNCKDRSLADRKHHLVSQGAAALQSLRIKCHLAVRPGDQGNCCIRHSLAQHLATLRLRPGDPVLLCSSLLACGCDAGL